MAASDHLSGYQFSYEKTPSLHGVYASHDGKGVGELEWAPSEGSPAFGLSPHEVRAVGVDEGHQRRGIATHMWGMAKEIDPDIRHSRELGDAGRGWSASLQGKR